MLNIQYSMFNAQVVNYKLNISSVEN